MPKEFKLTGLGGKWAVTGGPASVRNGEVLTVLADDNAPEETAKDPAAQVKEAWGDLGHALRAYDGGDDGE